MSRYIITDREWRDAGWRPKNWSTIMGAHEINSNARLIDRGPAVKFGQVAGYVARVMTRGIVKYARAVVAGCKAYKENVK